MEDHLMFEKILVAVDGSLDADAAVSAACEIAADGVSLHICHAFHIPEQYRSDIADAAEEELRRDGESALRHAVARARKAGIEARSHLLEKGAPADAVLKLALELDVSLIVVGVRGKSPDQIRSLGSVSSAVSQSAKCSVLLVRRKHGRAAT
jgi:nucleotide-binding universal stress UspA family protein